MLLMTGLAFLVIAVKLVSIQGINSRVYLASGGSEWEQTVILPGERGAIAEHLANPTNPCSLQSVAIRADRWRTSSVQPWLTAKPPPVDDRRLCRNAMA